MKSYGIIKSNNNINSHVENIRIKGFTIVKSILKEQKIRSISRALDKCYKLQELEFGRENLELINEADLLRCPLAYDPIFIDLIVQDELLNIVKEVIGNEILLQLQNGIINKPQKEHHQSSWHRDLPYQEFIISKPLAISVFYCIDKFESKTGSTILLPYSHKFESFPSKNFVNQNEYQVTADPGDVLVFDSMVFHKAGYNSSNIIRRGINNVFVAPLLKQQINLPKMLNGKYKEDPQLSKILGYKYDVAESVTQYREKKLSMLQK